MRFGLLSAILLALTILGCASHDDQTADNGATTKPHHSPLVHY
jgi:hypothetical protein